MLRVIAQGSHSKFLTTVLSLSPQGYSPMWHIWAEGQVHTLIEVSDLRVRILGETLQLQDRSRWHLSRCAEHCSWSLLIRPVSVMRHLGLCLVIWNEWCHWLLVIRCSLGRSGMPDWAILTCPEGIFYMLITFHPLVFEVYTVPMGATHKNY